MEFGSSVGHTWSGRHYAWKNTKSSGLATVILAPRVRLCCTQHFIASHQEWPKNGRVVCATPWGSGSGLDLCRAPSRFRGPSNATLRPAVAAFSGVRMGNSDLSAPTSSSALHSLCVYVIGSSHPNSVFRATRMPLSKIASQGQRPSALSVSDEQIPSGDPTHRKL
ncbi:hypothetical protein EDD16DRAFT_1035050 [Pisolithus croceorrhizus]|nr:hypothetical protein EDD16DRAFT_1035050 [Pisolithus croceorrhizus]